MSRFPYVSLSAPVEKALALCGRDRIMYNDQDPASIAIRREPIPMLGDKWLVKNGPSHDQAGRDAASAYADQLEEIGRNLVRQAEGIRSALKEIPHDR